MLCLNMLSQYLDYKFLNYLMHYLVATKTKLFIVYKMKKRY